MGTSPGPAPVGRESLRGPGWRPGFCPRQLVVPVALARLGSVPSLRAWALRGTSLCSLFSLLLALFLLLLVLSLVFCASVLGGLREAAPRARVSGEGPLGPRARSPGGFMGLELALAF